MKTKSLSVCFGLALTLSTLACIGVVPPAGVADVVNSRTPTATATASSTPTATFTSTPTKTPKPTYTATPRISEAIITAVQNVFIRSKPCYREEIAQAAPGTRFPATGWFLSPQKEAEAWVRIEFRRENGLLTEGWIRADLVDVTNSDLVPRVYEPCPNTPTHTHTATPTSERPESIRDSYIRVYQHESFGGASLVIRITDCGLVDIDPNSKLNDSISSFDLFAPDRVKVALVEHHSFDTRFPGRNVIWRGNNGHLKVDMAELVGWGLHDEVSSIVWLVDDKRLPGTCQR